MRIKDAQTDADIKRCFHVVAQLRAHLVAGNFVERVRRQEQAGFRMAFIEDEGRVVCVAGYRVSENMAWGHHLYVDDIVTDSAGRSKGYGKAMIQHLMEYARQQGCVEFHLDSGVQRFAAHRFYLRQGLDITSHHFSMRL